MNEKTKILLLGGGFTLQKLAGLLTDKNSFVITTRSAETKSKLEQQGFLSEIVDILDKDQLVSILNKYPNLKVMVDSVPPVADEISKFEQSLKILSERIHSSIYLSTTGVIGRTNGEIVNEQTLPLPGHERAKRRLNVEQIHKKFFKQSVTLRLPAIYGPGRGIGHSLKAKRYRLIEDGSRFTNRIHVADLAMVIAAVLNKIFTDEKLPDLLCVSDDHAATQKEVVDFYCRQFDLDYPEKISLLDANNQLDPTLLSNQQIDNSLMKKVLGTSLSFPSFREGAFSEFETSTDE